MIHLESRTPTETSSSTSTRRAGSVYAGLAIYGHDAVHRCEVATTCVGIAMSMGALLLAAGRRKSGRRCELQILIHQVSGGFQGQGTDIEDPGAGDDQPQARPGGDSSASTRIKPVDKVSKDMERDYYMTADEARDYGIVDNVVAHR